MIHYAVVSPEMTHYDESGVEPPDHFRCVSFVDATTARAAVIAAVKDRDMRKWVESARSDGANPFVGLKAQSERCEHGRCHCDKCHDFCAECEAEWEAMFPDPETDLA